VRRTEQVRVTLTKDEKADLRERARAHGQSVAAYARRTMLAGRPGSGSDVDEVLMSLPQKRKEQIVRWLLDLDRNPAPLPGQLALTDDAAR